MKQKRIYTYVLLLSVLLSAMSIRAQVVYQCDFENQLERQQWVLNSTSPTDTTSVWQNRWYMGSAGNYSQFGHWGLYISLQDNSDVATYLSNSASATVAYREMTLAPDNYTLEFDWRALGMGQNALLEVFWVPQATNTYSNNTGKYSNRIGTYKIANGTLYGSKPWQPARLNFTVTAADSQGKLVFIWVTTLRDAVKPPSACVDNIVISKQLGNCPSPTNIRYDKMTGTLSWSGNASKYEVRDYSVNEGKLSEYTDITTKSQTVDITSEGTHNFYIRAICDSTSWSPWVMTSFFTWIPGSRCIDYLDIGGNPSFKGVCYTGLFDDFIRNNRQGNMGISDRGATDDNSLHTIHMDLNEIDPNTTVNGGLNTVPDGEIASVRLGSRVYANTIEERSARIEYKYTVTAGMSDLLDLKYAVVMESGGHSASLAQGQDMNPTFTLNILDGQGKELDGCTQLYFVAGFGDQSNWHQEPSPKNSWYWCDWATVTVSLRQYVGQTLTIRLTATRCSYDTHTAYAYFTIGCRSGSLEGLACGDFSTDHFEAPEGFTYRWYKEDDASKTTLSTNRIYNIAPNEDDIYMVECHSTAYPECYFTLTANPNPRFPVAIFDTVVSHTNCQNVVDFTNSSVVRILSRSDGSVMSTQEPIQTIVYSYGDGSPDELVEGTHNRHIYPETGGTFDAMAIASMNDGMCQDTVRFRFNLPDLLHTGTYEDVHKCEGEYYILPSGDTVYQDTTYVTYSANKYGCMALNELSVYFHPESYDTTIVELCEGSYYEFEGKRYDHSGVYTVPLKTVYGCDSILCLNLTVIPRLEVETPDTVVVCADINAIEIPYQQVQGNMTDIHVYMSPSAQKELFDSVYHFTAGEDITIAAPSHLRAGYYDAEVAFTAPACQSDPKHIVIAAYYPTSIIRQKYTLIALLNAEYNGWGYVWTSYQWLCNGKAIVGATTSYLVVDDTHLGDEYVCILTRDDGVVIPTCPLRYNGGVLGVDDTQADLYVSSTIVPRGGVIQVAGQGDVTLYDILGRRISSHRREGMGGILTLTAPDRAGIYILTDSSHATTKIIVQ